MAVVGKRKWVEEYLARLQSSSGSRRGKAARRRRSRTAQSRMDLFYCEPVAARLVLLRGVHLSGSSEPPKPEQREERRGQ